MCTAAVAADQSVPSFPRWYECCQWGRHAAHLEGHLHPQQLSRRSGWPGVGLRQLLEAEQALCSMSCPQCPLPGHPAITKYPLVHSHVSKPERDRQFALLWSQWQTDVILCPLLPWDLPFRNCTLLQSRQAVLCDPPCAALSCRTPGNAESFAIPCRHLQDSHLKECAVLSWRPRGRLGSLQWRLQLSVHVEKGAQRPDTGAKVGLHSDEGAQPL